MKLENHDHKWVYVEENSDKMICKYCKKTRETAEKPPEPERKPTYATPRDPGC